jgi:cytochrome c6
MALALRVGATPPGVNLAAGCRPRGFVAPCASAAPPRQRNVRSFVACGAAAGVAAALLLAAAPLAAVATDPLVSLNAPELFLRTCAGCHAGGGNVVDMSRSLRAPDLERNGYKDSQTLSDVIYKGKARGAGRSAHAGGAGDKARVTS